MRGHCVGWAVDMSVSCSVRPLKLARNRDFRNWEAGKEYTVSDFIYDVRPKKTMKDFFHG